MTDGTALSWDENSVPTGRPFVAQRLLRFSDCDPSGIAFFPSYFVMLNGVVEDWWTHLGTPWTKLIGERRIGTPTMRLETVFFAPATFGETIEFHLHVENIGRSVLVFQHHVFGLDHGIRWRARQHLVATSLATHRSTPWPDDVRQAVLQFMETS